MNWPIEVKLLPTLLLLKIYFTTDYITNIDEIIYHFDLPMKDILLTTSKITTKNDENDFNTETLENIDLSFLTPTEINHITSISETLTSFDDIIQATIIQLWQTTIQKNRQLEASKKLTTRLTKERTLSVTVATKTAISNGLNNLEESITGNQITQLRVLNLENNYYSKNKQPMRI
jgi:hypothetical protein